MGRRKIEMRKVEDRSTRQVTFSKRRNGVFKKANELATLCAAKVAVVVFSPGGRPYSYGNPSVMAVTERFLGQQGTSDDQPENANANAGQGSRRKLQRRAKIVEQRTQLDRLIADLEVEKSRGRELEDRVRGTCGLNNIKELDDLDSGELKEFKKRLEDLYDEIMNKVRDMEVSSTLMMLSKDKTPFDPEGFEGRKKKKRTEERRRVN